MKQKKKRAFALLEHFDEIATSDSFLTKRMFGSLAIYHHGLMVALLSESPGDRTYKEVKYSFDLWNGVLFPTLRDHHGSLKTDFPQLLSHPVLGKWLYLPLQTENFEEVLALLIRHIRRRDPRLGIVPGEKKKSRSKSSSKRNHRKK